MNTSTASTTHAAVTQHWTGKAPSLPKGKWLKRALGAALKRDRSTRLVADMIELARQFGRYGYRRIAALLGEAARSVSDGRIERLWRREGLKVPQK